MNARWLFVASLQLVSRLAFASSDEEAEDQLVEAALAFRSEDWDRALAAVDRARSAVGSPELSARIERQAGLILAALDRPAAALEAFRTALDKDESIRIESWRFGPGVNSLFECALNLPRGFPRVERLQADGDRGWICPGSEPAEETVGSPEPTPSSSPPDFDLEPKPARPFPDAAVEGFAAAPPSGGLGALGTVGIVLTVVGLGAGGGLYAWQRFEAEESDKRVRALNRVLSNESLTPRQSPQAIFEFNNARQERSDRQYRAALAAGIGGGVAALGLSLLLIDVFSGPSEAAPSAAGGEAGRHRSLVARRAPIAFGVGFDSVSVRVDF